MAETRRDEQKLWLILFQIKAVRTRLNLLAIQYWLFVTIAILIAAGTAIFVLAAVLSPIAFLIVAALVSVSALVTLVRVARMAIRKAANPMRAALIADERADLKGRLATVLALAAAPPQSSLWPYLVEDTYGLRGRFEPAQIEPRWLSRAILAPLAAGLAVLALSAALNYYARLASRGLVLPQSDITADIGDLEVLPADPAVKPNARVYADANTLRQLEAKIAEAKKDRGSSWMDKARRLAGNLQDQVTGRNPLPMPSIHLKSSNPSAPNTPPSQVARSTPPGPAADGDGKPAQTNPGAGASGLGNPGNPGPQAPAVSIPGQEADQLAQNGAAAPSQPGANQSGGAGGPSAAVPNAGDGAGGGSSHGAGSDPEHLFGPPEAQQLGSDSFKIAIEAVPSDEASGKGAPAYIPPKVRVPLNLLQFPDAPLARTSIPPGDRMTIKKVFER